MPSKPSAARDGLRAHIFAAVRRSLTGRFDVVAGKIERGAAEHADRQARSRARWPRSWRRRWRSGGRRCCHRARRPRVPLRRSPGRSPGRAARCARCGPRPEKSRPKRSGASEMWRSVLRTARRGAASPSRISSSMAGQAGPSPAGRAAADPVERAGGHPAAFVHPQMQPRADNS